MEASTNRSQRTFSSVVNRGVFLACSHPWAASGPGTVTRDRRKSRGIWLRYSAAGSACSRAFAISSRSIASRNSGQSTGFVRCSANPAAALAATIFISPESAQRDAAQPMMRRAGTRIRSTPLPSGNPTIADHQIEALRARQLSRASATVSACATSKPAFSRIRRQHARGIGMIFHQQNRAGCARDRLVLEVDHRRIEQRCFHRRERDGKRGAVPAPGALPRRCFRHAYRSRACEIASPSPSPPNCARRRPAALLERVEDARQQLRLDPDAGVGDLDDDVMRRIVVRPQFRCRPPAGVNLTAFFTRFQNTCCSRAASRPAVMLAALRNCRMTVSCFASRSEFADLERVIE